MIRTQISLFEDDYELAKEESARLGVSLAEYFRQALQSVLPKKSDKPWMQYTGMVESGDPHSSQNIDDVIYGPKN